MSHSLKAVSSLILIVTTPSIFGKIVSTISFPTSWIVINFCSDVIANRFFCFSQDDKTNKMACAPSKDSDQPGQPQPGHP